MGGQPDLDRFTRKLAAGDYGDVTPERIAAFLREVEMITVNNIETKAAQGGPFAAMREQVIDETRTQVARLLKEYGATQT